MRPREADDRRAAVVDELNGPPALVLDPHEDDARGVARGKLLVGLVPTDQRYLQALMHDHDLGLPNLTLKHRVIQK